jgi:hypothetical protein
MNNYMKNTILVSLLACMCTWVACESNDIQPRLVGTWNMQQVETETQIQGDQPRKQTEVFEGETAQISFKTDGTFQAKNFLLPIEGVGQGPLNVQGTYTAEGKILTLTFRQPDERTNVRLLFTTNIRQNTMILNMNKDQFFVTIDAFAASDPLVRLVLTLYKTTLRKFNLTYTFSKS